MTAQAVRLTSVDIDNALKNRHFEVIFQPIFRLEDGHLYRMEAFVRWVHPGLGTLPPGAFISFFETQQRMGELTRYVIAAAIEGYKAWRGTKGPGLSVNLALSDLEDDEFGAWLSEELSRQAFPGSLLTLECPAFADGMDSEAVVERLEKIQSGGVRLAIEVRGRAREDLIHLSPFVFDEIKTGGSAILRFARTMRGGPGMAAISELQELADKHGAAIAAVGVEDEESLKALAALGFTAAQGNFLCGVGEVKSFSASRVNEVRSVLGLKALTQRALREAFDDELPGTIEDEEEKMLELAPEEMVTTGAASQANKQPAVKKPAGKKPARKTASRRTARPAAKKPRPSASSPSKPEKAAPAENPVAKEIDELEAVKAAKRAEENARKLQDRLSRAYNLRHSGSTSNDQAGMVLGGSLAETALNRPMGAEEQSDGDTEPQTAATNEAVIDTGELSPDGEEAVIARDHKSTEGDVTGSTADKKESIIEGQNDQGRDDERSPADPGEEADEKILLNDTDEAEGNEPAETDSGATAEKDEADEPVLELRETQATSNLKVEIIGEERLPDAIEIAADADREPDSLDPQDVFSDDGLDAVDEEEDEDVLFRSEDEILDEVFSGTDRFDPADHTVPEPETGDDHQKGAPEDQALAANLVPRRRPRKQKNFLMRKYKIRVTHFWPRSWRTG